MELRQLQYFVAVVEEANFTRAAARLHVAQPRVSAQIRQLERELGQPLLDRSGRSVTVTEVGEAVLAHARAALAAAEGIRQTVDQFSGLLRGRVRIGLLSGAASNRFDMASSWPTSTTLTRRSRSRSPRTPRSGCSASSSTVRSISP